MGGDCREAEAGVVSQLGLRDSHFTTCHTRVNQPDGRTFSIIKTYLGPKPTHCLFQYLQFDSIHSTRTDKPPPLRRTSRLKPNLAIFSQFPQDLIQERRKGLLNVIRNIAIHRRYNLV